LQDLGLEVIVRYDLWDQVKGEQYEINDAKYQRSLRDTGGFQRYLPEHRHILQLLADEYAVEYRLRLEEEFLRQPELSRVIRGVIKNRSTLGKYLMPSTGTLALRASCPTCGLVDKYGANNVYAEDGSSVSFQCPHHGRFSYDMRTETHRVQFNCQLFNLVMGLFYEQVDYGWIEICGAITRDSGKNNFCGDFCQKRRS
jgi:hypothetical protein